MMVYGLATHPGIIRYLKDVRGVTRVEDSFGLPVFLHGHDYFLGGFKNFYSLVADVRAEEFEELLEKTLKTYPLIQCDFASADDLHGGPLGASVLDVSACRAPEDRFAIYHKKTRNQVRKSYQNDLHIEIGPVPKDFYRLYRESMRRLGSVPKDEQWFTELERYAGSDIIAISAYTADVLVGVNYVVRNGAYCMLMFNVSDQMAWQWNVNDRLYDELISWAIEQGIVCIDFGPSLLGDSRHNHFKEGFGATSWYISQKQYGPLSVRLRSWLARKRYAARLRFKSLRPRADQNHG